MDRSIRKGEETARGGKGRDRIARNGERGEGVIGKEMDKKGLRIKDKGRAGEGGKWTDEGRNRTVEWKYLRGKEGRNRTLRIRKEEEDNEKMRRERNKRQGENRVMGREGEHRRN